MCRESERRIDLRVSRVPPDRLIREYIPHPRLIKLCDSPKNRCRAVDFAGRSRDSERSNSAETAARRSRSRFSSFVRKSAPRIGLVYPKCGYRCKNFFLRLFLIADLYYWLQRYVKTQSRKYFQNLYLKLIIISIIYNRISIFRPTVVRL